MGSVEKNPFISVESRQRKACFIWNKAIKLLGLEFSDSSRNNLATANELLKNHTLIVFANHSSRIFDPLLTISMAFNFLTNAKRIMGPAAAKHYFVKRDPISAPLFRLIESFGITIFPIVQPASVDKKADAYSPKEVEQMRADLREATAQLAEPGSLYGIAPEGTTRFASQGLQRAHKGIGWLDEYDQKKSFYYVPVGIVYKKFGSSPRITVGKPYQIRNLGIRDDEIPLNPKDKAQYYADKHMYQLAQLLPSHMRGVYNIEHPYHLYETPRKKV